MLKGLITLNLLLLLALQPAGSTFAGGGDLRIQSVSDNVAVSEIACERMINDDCAGVSHCLASGHVGCDMNPFQPVTHSSISLYEYADYPSLYGLTKLPLNETFPPLRPPRHS